LLFTGIIQINTYNNLPYYRDTSKEVNVSIFDHLGFD